MNYRFATHEDAKTLTRLDADNLTYPWSLTSWRQSTEYDTTILSYSDTHLVGFITYRLKPPEVEVYKLVTTSSNRRKGYARRLLQYFIENMKKQRVIEIFVEVESKNEAAISFYRSEVA